MVFSGLPFIFVFLPICILAYFVMPNLKAKNIVLLLASLFFYAIGEPVWVFLMILSAFINYAAGLIIDKRRGTACAKIALIVAVISGIAFLVAFKYLDFIIENVNTLLPFARLPLTNIALPIGISFFTFQTMSYTIDVYKNDVKVQKNYFTFLLFVSLFPQLIAGPILRYSDVALQLENRTTTVSGFCKGITRFLCGCGKKVLLANTIGEISTLIFTGEYIAEGVPVFGVWVGALCLSLQIYFDFSGYSDMAIGLGYMFGFEYGENFNYPYISRSVTDFWRRWHISLGTFFRDYVYIPMGGNRKHQFFNLLVVWSLTGLWHGASWNFVIWGLYYFVFLVLEKFILRRRLERIPVLSNITTLLVVMVGWTIFFFEDIGQCLAALRNMFGLGNVPLWDSTLTTPIVNNLMILIIGVIACIPIGRIVGRQVESIKESRPTVYFTANMAFNIVMLFLCTAALVGASYNPFLYFRF